MAVSHRFLLFMTLIVVYDSVYTSRLRNYNIVKKLGCAPHFTKDRFAWIILNDVIDVNNIF